jgi:pimeloyl-ACP methyl ester carboxylesterase
MFDTKEKRKRTTGLLYQLVVQEPLLQKIQHAFETTFNNIPALLVYGEKDSLAKLGVPQRIKKMMKNAELHIIKGVEHFPHEGTPDEISNIISNWILKFNSKII